MLGYALCGSFCTHAQSLGELKKLIAEGYEVQPIVSETVYVTVCDAEGNAISNTYRYSIESYAFAKEQGIDANLATLVVAMMKYGNAAKNYNG